MAVRVSPYVMARMQRTARRVCREPRPSKFRGVVLDLSGPANELLDRAAHALAAGGGTPRDWQRFVDDVFHKRKDTLDGLLDATEDWFTVINYPDPERV